MMYFQASMEASQTDTAPASPEPKMLPDPPKRTAVVVEPGRGTRFE